ncbi:hypothetical protein V5O48_007051 [Marasmius crinis-equi]|uniref:Saccharopine dehydrogenase NADP binding domain-containing protein n=1 Tax=Marasmius crinis-equi TaxID=585013 RepID=A0ABR3FIJ1_9AGAR
MSKTSDILVLGATGLTGRQATKFLAAHPDRTSKKFTLAIAGRSKKKLDALVSDLGLPQDIRVITLDVTNEHEVNEAVKLTRVVLNTVGPYYRWGTPVVRACATHGVHYVDLTGESLWIARIIRQFDYQAMKTRAIIVPACGFDSIPSDISVFIGNKALKDLDPSLNVASSTTVFTKVAGTLSLGTLDSMIGMRLLPTSERNDLQRDYLLSPVQDGPPSLGIRPIYRLQVPGTPKKTVTGTFWLMMPSNKPIVQRSWGLLEHEFLSKKSAGSEISRARYGPSVVYDEFLKTRGTLSAAILATTLGIFWGLLGLAPFRWLARRLVSRVDNATDEQLDNGSFVTTNVTTSTTSARYPRPIQVTTTLKGKGDAGYLLSPIWMAECAMALLDTGSLPELARRGGILTPATAFGDVLVKRLEANERMTVHYEVHKGTEESRKNI